MITIREQPYLLNVYVNKRLLSPDFELSLPHIAMDQERTRSGYIDGQRRLVLIVDCQTDLA